MKLALCLLAIIVIAHLASAQDEEPGKRRRLVVRRRKRPVGTGAPAASPNQALLNLQKQILASDGRGGRSLLGRTPFTNGAGNFGQRLGGANRGGPVQLSTFADLHRPQEAPYTARGAQRRRPGPPRAAPAAPNFQQHQQTHGGINIQNVPGFKQHQLHLQRHQQQIQAQLALAGGKGVAQHHRQVRPQPRPASAARRRPRPHPALARRPQQVIAHPPPRPTPRPTRPRVAPAIHVAQPVEHHQNHHIVAAPAVQHVAAPVQPVAHHHEHHEHHVIAPAPAPVQPAGPPVVALEPIPVRQGLVPENNLIDLGEVAVAGEKCIDKLVVVEETETDEQVECHHSYDQKCHTTYTTDFEPQSEEKCEETFKKNCFIEYSKTALNETVEVCHTPLVKDCNVPGPVECITEYESECETTYHTHTVEEDVPECVTLKEVKCETKDRGYTTEEDCTEWPVERCNVRTELVNKVTPETACRKVPKEKCAPQGCGFVQGVPECFDKVETVIQEVPEEKCDLEPQRECKHVTALVPKLQPHEECVDVPKEVCVRSEANPRRVTKPILKKWCYTPSRESGLFR